jgi:hypothetical protein
MVQTEAAVSEDRKYRQRGYRDDDRDRPKTPKPPSGPREKPEGPRTPNLMGTHQVFRCARCARIQAAEVGLEDRCPQCGTDLHSCIQCDSFDPGSTFECTQPIKARFSPKDVRNTCTLFAARTTVERQTGSTPAPDSGKSAAQAFDDLFKF